MVIVAKINNASSSDMTPKFSLTQNVVYRANSNTKHESNVIQKLCGNCIKSKTQKEVRCVMKIPCKQMQTIHNCEIISVEYYLKVCKDVTVCIYGKAQ